MESLCLGLPWQCYEKHASLSRHTKSLIALRQGPHLYSKVERHSIQKLF
jgi:hypothetical protein